DEARGEPVGSNRRSSARRHMGGRSHMRHRRFKELVLGSLGIAAIALASVSVAGAGGSAGAHPALIAAAKKEGQLNTIPLPADWANYGEIMAAFQKQHGIKITNANPNGSSAEENQAVISLTGQKRAPDVLDVGPAFAIQGAKQGLYVPYKNSNWATIPASM